MEYYGFGQPTGIDLTGEIGGILPSPAYKRKTRKEARFPGDTVNISIGQGDWKVTRCSWRAASARWPTASCAPAPGDPAARRIRQRLDGNAGRRKQADQPQPQQRAGRARGHDGDHAARRQRLARGGGCAVRDGRQDRYRTGHQPQGHCCSEPEEPADAPAPPRAVRWLRAGRKPGDRDCGGGGRRWLRWFSRGADRSQGVRCLPAGQDARRHAAAGQRARHHCHRRHRVRQRRRERAPGRRPCRCTGGRTSGADRRACTGACTRAAAGCAGRRVAGHATANPAEPAR